MLEMLIPGELQGREHGRIGFGGVGQLVEDDDPALGLEGRRDDLPEIRPAFEGDTALGRILSHQPRVERAPLHAGWRLFGDPVGEGDTARFGPVPEQGGFS
jgi:hypothetical protein